MWNGLADIARREQINIHSLCTFVADTKPDDVGSSTALRVYLFSYFRSAASEHAHLMAGHGMLSHKFPALRGDRRPCAVKKALRDFLVSRPRSDRACGKLFASTPWARAPNMLNPTRKVLNAEGLGFFGLFSDILQIRKRRARPQVNHEMGRLAILIDSEVVDGG
jgi:Ribbon-helix-helix domain